MVLTFTVKAADELVSRISSRLLKQDMTESAIGISDARIGRLRPSGARQRSAMRCRRSRFQITDQDGYIGSRDEVNYVSASSVRERNLAARSIVRTSKRRAAELTNGSG